MKTKLRLLVTEECNRNCDGCCNKDYDLKNLPVVDSFEGYDEIIITGGEPLLYKKTVSDVLSRIKIENKSAKIILYTARTTKPTYFIILLSFIDGVTITLHEQSDVEPFLELAKIIKKSTYPKEKSLRLNIFEGIGIDTSRLKEWKIKKDMVWIKDCPLPKDEVFKKL